MYLSSYNCINAGYMIQETKNAAVIQHAANAPMQATIGIGDNHTSPNAIVVVRLVAKTELIPLSKHCFILMNLYVSSSSHT